jgi:hypothetical protein
MPGLKGGLKVFFEVLAGLAGGFFDYPHGQLLALEAERVAAVAEIDVVRDEIMHAVIAADRAA